MRQKIKKTKQKGMGIFTIKHSRKKGDLTLTFLALKKKK